MDLSLSDFKLVDSFCNLYNLSHMNADYFIWADSIRHAYSEFSPEKRREYVKSLKWPMCKKNSRPYLFQRLVERIFIKKRIDQLSISDVHKIERKIKVKHSMEHFHHSCYSVTSMIKGAQCECCGSTYYMSQYYSPDELGSKICSSECAFVFRANKNLKSRYDLGLISRRHRMAKGDSELHRFLSYLAGQQLIKRKKKNKGKFTWA